MRWVGIDECDVALPAAPLAAAEVEWGGGGAGMLVVACAEVGLVDEDCVWPDGSGG